jgi:PAS domain-containing protein
VSDGVASLLNFLDAPIVVGDPEGRVIYVNPSFERHFCKSGGEVRGEPLAMIFGGGGREAILQAVADVCTRGETVRFRLREDGAGYLGVASPIEAETDRVGVVILLTIEPATDERLLVYQSEIAEPMEEAMQCFEEILEQTGGRRSEQHRVAVERGIGAIDRARKWSDELHSALCGRTRGPGGGSSLDPVRVVRLVASRLSEDFEGSGVDLELLLPGQLPMAAGEAAMLETALVRLIRHRLGDAPEGGQVTLSARRTFDAQVAGLLFSVIDRPRPQSDPLGADVGDAEPEPRMVRATVSALGGRVCTLEIPGVGRVTSIFVALAEAS